MHRTALEYLDKWKSRTSRKPLVVRGARQVGKSFLVRLFAESHFSRLIEVNFERNPEHASLFSSHSPRETVRNLELLFGERIEPGGTLLFLDEIQAAPSVLAALRYFHEELPELHVVAAGSLLEFVLEDHEFSMPVGRIEYLHLGPMQFEEFLLALGQDKLVPSCRVGPGVTRSPRRFTRLLRLLRQFLATGGMPGLVSSTTSNRFAARLRRGQAVDPIHVSGRLQQVPEARQPPASRQGLPRATSARGLEILLRPGGPS